MTDKATKLLAKLTPKQRSLILLTIEQLSFGNTQGLDIKPIKGHPDTFRVRIGNYRIIYNYQDKIFGLIAIARRDDQTYR